MVEDTIRKAGQRLNGPQQGQMGDLPLYGHPEDEPGTGRAPRAIPGTGLEPAHLTALDPKSSVSTNSTTPAFRGRQDATACAEDKQRGERFPAIRFSCALGLQPSIKGPTINKRPGP